MNELHNFGQRFSKLFERLGLKQKDAAEMLDLSQSFMSHVFRGERGLGYDKLILLADKTNVNLHWLLTGQGSQLVSEEGSIAPRYLEIFSFFQHELESSLQLVKTKLVHDIPDRELEKLDYPSVLELERAAIGDEDFVSKNDSLINLEELGRYPQWLDGEIKRLVKEGRSRKEAVLAIKERRYSYVRADAVNGEGINFRKIYRYLLGPQNQ